MGTAASFSPDSTAAEVAELTLAANVVTPKVAALRDNDNDDTFLARADSALYSAKARGRDRIATS